MDNDFYSLVWYFVLYSFLGWCVEVWFCSIKTGKFVNRGFLSGPVCPIYGFGMLAVIVCLEPVSGDIVTLYFGAVILTSLIELVTGFALKKIFKTSWWDYTGIKFNIGGYICLTFSLLWGVGGVLAVKILHPVVRGLVHNTPKGIGVVLLILLIIALICDLVVTVNSITKLNKDLGRIAQMADLLHKGSETLAENLGTTAIGVNEKFDNVREDVQEKKPEISARMDMLKASLCDNADFMRRRLLKAFPNMKSVKTPQALEQLKKWLSSQEK